MPPLGVPGHRAVELVLAGLQVDGDLGRAGADDRALLVDAVAADRDVVGDPLRVLGRDLDLAGLGLGVGELERGAGLRPSGCPGRRSRPPRCPRPSWRRRRRGGPCPRPGRAAAWATYAATSRASSPVTMSAGMNVCCTSLRVDLRITVGVQDLLVDDAGERALPEAVLARLGERGVQVRPGRAGRAGARERVAGRALLGEQLLAVDRVRAAVLERAAAERQRDDGAAGDHPSEAPPAHRPHPNRPRGQASRRLRCIGCGRPSCWSARRGS